MGHKGQSCDTPDPSGIGNGLVRMGKGFIDAIGKALPTKSTFAFFDDPKRVKYTTGNDCKKAKAVYRRACLTSCKLDTILVAGATWTITKQLKIVKDLSAPVACEWTLLLTRFLYVDGQGVDVKDCCSNTKPRDGELPPLSDTRRTRCREFL